MILAMTHTEKIVYLPTYALHFEASLYLNVKLISIFDSKERKISVSVTRLGDF